MHPATLIDPASRLRLEGAIFAAEERSEGEIVLVVAERCDDYQAARWRFGVALAAAAFLGLYLFGPALPVWGLGLAQGFTLFIALAATRWDPLLRLLIPRAVCEARVDARVRRAFHEHGLHRTRHATGVLLYVALLERRFAVLGDRGVNEAMPPGSRWDDIVSGVTQALRNGDAVAGLADAIRQCGDWMGRALPLRGENRNELSDRVILEDRGGVIFEDSPL